MWSLFLPASRKDARHTFPSKSTLKAIRNKLGMTQARFSNTFGFSLDAIKHWEGGRRPPEAPARTLLTVIDRNPTAVLTALKPAAFAAAVGSSNVRFRENKKPTMSSGTRKRMSYHPTRVKRSTRNAS
jgi:putative transcriptional regulator